MSPSGPQKTVETDRERQRTLTGEHSRQPGQPGKKEHICIISCSFAKGLGFPANCSAASTNHKKSKVWIRKSCSKTVALPKRNMPRRLVSLLNRRYPPISSHPHGSWLGCPKEIEDNSPQEETIWARRYFPGTTRRTSFNPWAQPKRYLFDAQCCLKLQPEA